jgi:cytochrome c-type biogenesis protein CcmH/NrfG
MDRAQQRGFWNNLAYSLVLLGLVVIALGVVTFLLQGRQMAKPPVETLAHSQTTTDRLVESLQTRLKNWSQDQNVYVQLGDAYIQKARETGDPSYYSRAEAVLLKALELNPNNASAMSSIGALALGQHLRGRAMG